MDRSRRKEILQNVGNDELYEDLAEFLNCEFEDIDGFYMALAFTVVRLEKKYDLRFSPYEYIFIMRSIGELKIRNQK